MEEGEHSSRRERFLEDRVSNLETRVEELTRYLADSDHRMQEVERTLAELLREKIANATAAASAAAEASAVSAATAPVPAVRRNGEIMHTPRKRRHADGHVDVTLRRGIVRSVVNHASNRGLPKFKFSETITSKSNRETVRLLANAAVDDPSLVNDQGERPTVEVIQDTLMQYFKSKRDRRNESSLQVAQHNIEARRKQRRQRRTKERITTAGNLLRSSHVPPELARLDKDEDLTQHALFSLLACSEYETDYEEDELGNLQKVTPAKYRVKIPSWRSGEASQALHFLDSQRGSGSQQRLEYNHDEAEVVASRRPEKVSLDSWMVDEVYREVVARNGNAEIDPRESKSHRYTSMADERAARVVELQSRVNALRREADSLSPTPAPDDVIDAAAARREPSEGNIAMQIKDENRNA